jgi:hypothetical protein
MPVFEAVHAGQAPFNPPVPTPEAVTTWRYLRLAIVVMVVGLGASVLYEHARTGTGCWQPSISSYYYTPAQGAVVGALVAIGVCLICLRGNTDWEDILLNVAGACAPVTAFVPTPDRGTCGVILTGTEGRDLNIGNNMTAFLVAGGVGLVTVGAVLVSKQRGGSTQRPSRTSVTGYLATLVLYVATALAFGLARGWFIANGHAVAAVTMFALFIANVWLNAINLYFTRRTATGAAPVLNPYTVIGALMTTAAVVLTVVGLGTHWAYWKLVLEATLIVLFGVFWVLQTIELWNAGLRRDPIPAAPMTAATYPR